MIGCRHVASVYGSAEIAELLMEKGAKRNVHDAFGATFDDYIASPGHSMSGEVALKTFGIATRKPVAEPNPRADSEGAAACDADGGWDTGHAAVAESAERCDIDRPVSHTL